MGSGRGQSRRVKAARQDRLEVDISEIRREYELAKRQGRQLMPSRDWREKLRATVKEGMRVELTAPAEATRDKDTGEITYEESIKPGDTGTVGSIDDAGSISVKWDHGSSLAVLPSDSFVVYTTSLAPDAERVTF